MWFNGLLLQKRAVLQKRGVQNENHSPIGEHTLSWKCLSVDAPPATRVVKFLRPKILLTNSITSTADAGGNKIPYCYPIIMHSQIFERTQDDLWPCPMWPLTLTHVSLTHVTFDLDPRDLWPPWSFVKYTKQNPRKSFLPWWPWPLTYDLFIHDLDTINVHHHTKFGDPTSNGSWDMNFCPGILV